MIWITFIISLFYIGLVLWLFIGNSRLPETSTQSVPPTIGFTIVVPFRNESKNLLELIESLRQLDYPSKLCEIIFVDDDSSDGSVLIIEKEFQNKKNPIAYSILKNEQTSGSPKKNAITLANKKASKDWIIVTDADCEVPKNWLRAYNEYILAVQPKLICGPVATKANGSTLQRFQELEGFSLQSATWAGFGLKTPFLCNGANMAYKRETFIALDGYLGNDHISSGDDVFLLEKAQIRFPNDVYYLKNKDAIVITKPVYTWQAILNQRQRWASKTKNQKSKLPKLVGLVVFTVNFWMVFGLIAHLFWLENLMNFLVFLMFKCLLDALLLSESSKFFGRNLSLLSYLKTAIIYPPLTLLIVMRSFYRSNHWKGRQIAK